MTLTDDKVIDIVYDFIEANEGLVSITYDDADRVLRTYKRLMNESVNKKKTLQEQEIFVEDICIDFSNGANEEQEFKDYGDMRYLSSYDNFLGEGESDKIVTALHENGLSSEILKGVKFKIKQTLQKRMENGDLVEIRQYIDPSPKGGEASEEEYFEIYVNGRLIYKWKRL